MQPDQIEQAENVTRPTHLFPHFAGAAVTKLAPPLVQLLLLLLVARESTLDDVGRLALASAASFLCGALGELGFATTLSIPRPTFGTPSPPLRATGRVRVVSAVAGSLLYLVLWGAGLVAGAAQLLEGVDRDDSEQDEKDNEKERPADSRLESFCSSGGHGCLDVLLGCGWATLCALVPYPGRHKQSRGLGGRLHRSPVCAISAVRRVLYGGRGRGHRQADEQ